MALAWQEPGDGVVSPTTHLGQEGHLGLFGPERALPLGLFNQCLVREDGLKLITPNGNHEEAKEYRLQDQNHRMEDARLAKGLIFVHRF